VRARHSWFHGVVAATAKAAASKTATGGSIRSVIAEWPFAVVFTPAVISVIVIALGALKHGLILLGGALLLGSVLRFVLPAARAGLLAVRRRGVDVVTMALLGLVLVLLALVPQTM
jgi:Protein of unknown function (DUF3017)